MPDRPLDGLRVALVLATSTGGVGRHVHSLAGGLLALGADVTVLGPAATEGVFGFAAVGAAFTPVEIPASPHPVADLRAVRRLRSALTGVDVVHAHGLRAGLVATLASRRGAGPVVVTWHNAVLVSGPRRRVYAAFERAVARRADLTLGASEDLVVRASALGAPDARLGPVAAPPLPPSRRDRADVRRELGAAGRPLVVAVGRLHPQKGFPTLVEAAARLADRDPAPLVVIAGDGPSRHDLQTQITSTGAPVRLLGRREDVADLLAAADVVALPSVWEARSLVAQEALRAGRPLVTTPVGGMPGLVGGGAAELVPAGDAGALADAVAALLDDPVAAAELGRRGAVRAAQWPTETEMVAQVAAVYRELIGWSRV